MQCDKGVEFIGLFLRALTLLVAISFSINLISIPKTFIVVGTIEGILVEKTQIPPG